MRILIVEDEIKIRKGIANLIQNHTEHTVVGEAKNGLEGMEMTLTHQPDLIITDIRMPQMDGLEMIRKLKEQNGAWRFVILSGYSEFEYAKQALRYGAEDYLLKPLAPEDVTGMLETIQEKIQAELKKAQGRPEKKLRDYLIENETGSIQDLERICGFERNEILRLIGAYAGDTCEAEKSRCLQIFERLKESLPAPGMHFFFTESTREFICLAPEQDWSAMEPDLNRKLFQRPGPHDQWAWASCRVNGIGRLKEDYEKLKNLYFYGMALGYDRFLTAERVEQFQAKPYQYPRNLEAHLQKSFYQEDKEAFADLAKRFLQEMRLAGIKPVQVKEGYMKMVDFLTNLAQENNQNAYDQLQNLHTVRRIGRAVTLRELEEVFGEVAGVLESHMNRPHAISNYTIKRALDYIRLHYGESISLDEVAAKLDITPEYLSTLFNREMDENFSVFLKKFRISHAKRLLKGTDKKIYEIAREVGYGDPKYFNRVFKDEEGISPGDYRNLQK